MWISAILEVDSMKKTLERNKIVVLRFKAVKQLRMDLSKRLGSLLFPFQQVATCNGMCIGPRLARSSTIAVELLPKPFSATALHSLQSQPKGGRAWRDRAVISNTCKTCWLRLQLGISQYTLFSIKSVQPAGMQMGWCIMCCHREVHWGASLKTNSCVEIACKVYLFGFF